MAYSINAKNFFNTKLYTGTGSSLALTGVGFQPDMVWQKVRSTTSSHRITDAVRGVGQVIYPNDTAQQSAESAVTAFGTDGFTVGTEAGVNTSSATYVAWNWKAGTGQGSANTDGTINTTYTSVNTTSGVSIIKYNGNGSAGATIGHGLGVAPKFVMIKRTDTSSNWIVGTGARGFNLFSYLNTNGTETANSGTFNNTSPSSSVITLGSWNDVNNASGTYIAYAFAEKTGFSNFGSYTAYENVDGTFNYTGFKPAFIMIKRTDSAASWVMFDSERPGYNVANYQLYANSNTSYGNNNLIDMVSNGFKCRTTHADVNSNNSVYIYMAFAKAPLVGTNNIPATAR
jgi:hypothetical protein